MADLKNAVLSVAKYLGLFRLSRRLTRNRLRILCYHGIWLDLSRPNPFNFLYMQPARFAHRMQRLKDLGYPVLPLDEALQRLDDGTLPANAVAITIDDGWYGTYLHMVPELLRHRFPATIYLTTYHAEKQTAVFSVALHYILLSAPVRSLAAAALDVPGLGSVDLDNPVQRAQGHATINRFADTELEGGQREALLAHLSEVLGFDWEQVRRGRYFHLMTLDEARACALDGLDFQLHTHRHRVTRDGSVCIEDEIADNRACLARVTTIPATHFCYPSGNWAPEHFLHLRRAGVVSATTTDNGFCAQGTNRMALPRILDGDRVTPIEFEAELCGFMELKRLLQSRLRRRSS